MLRLSLSRKPQLLAIGTTGVSVEVRPISTAINEAALAEARRRAGALATEADVAERAGQPLDARGANGANAAWLEGQRTAFYIEALARYAIIRWDGLAGDDGQPLPVTADAIAAFAAHPDLGVAFLGAYGRSLAELSAEGNGSAPSSAGDSAAAISPAADAPAPPDGPASALPMVAGADPALS